MPNLLHPKFFYSVVSVVMVSAASNTYAQGAYRCEDNGKISYQATPCAGGKAIVPAADVSQADRDRARKQSEMDSANARQMERERAARARVPANKAGAGEISGMKATSMSEREVEKPNKKKKGGHQKHKSQGKKMDANKAKPKKSGAAKVK